MAPKNTKKTKESEFKAVAMIDGIRKNVTITAISLAEAREKFKEQYPGNPVPDLK